MDSDTGAIIVEVADGTPADEAGLQHLEVVMSFAGVEITNAATLSRVGRVIALLQAELPRQVGLPRWPIESPDV